MTITVQELLKKEIDPVFAYRAKIILENLDPAPNTKILEVGCGRGFYLAAVSQLLPNAVITGIDINQKYLTKAQQTLQQISPAPQNINLLKASAANLPFADQVFNQVICSEVLEHIQDDTRAIAEIYRVLKPSGSVIFTVPHKNYPFFWDPINFVLEKVLGQHIPANIWWLAGIWANHIRLYTQEELISKLQRVGFSTSTIWCSTRYTFPFSHFLLYGLGKNLVELNLMDKSFNRFNHNSKISLLNKIAGLPFRLVNQLNYTHTTANKHNGYGYQKRFVNLIVKANKMN